MHHVPWRVFWQHQITQVILPPYSPDLALCDFWLFPNLKSPWKRRDFRLPMRFRKIRWGGWWLLGELCEVPGAYFKGDWGVIVLCTMFLVSCIFFNKCLLYFISHRWILSGQMPFAAWETVFANILPFFLHYVLTFYYVLSTVINPLPTLSLLILQQAFWGEAIIIIINSISQMRKYYINNIGQITKFKIFLSYCRVSFTWLTFK